MSNNTILGDDEFATSIIWYSWSNISIANSIIWSYFDIPIVYIELGDEAIIRYSDIKNGYEGEGNIESDPLFSDPSTDDFTLQPSSPCIDAGDPNSPLDPDGTVAVMGAFYYHQTASYNLGDLNQDSSVDILDVVLLVGIILGEEPTEWEAYAGDLNSDGSIDVLDVVQLVNVILEG